jgi:AraC family transcriptional regulator
MQPEIRWLPEIQLIGISQSMTLETYRVDDLWRTFMPRRYEIPNPVSEVLFHVQVNPDAYNFAPNMPFEKWAALEVATVDFIPVGMQVLTIPAGQYAVFTYSGDGSDAAAFFRNIYTQWLPKFGLVWENRIQFELLGEKYKKNAADSEEQIFIPVR